MGIERATRDRWIFGVCGGIAHAFGWNSNLVRLATALLGLVIPGVSMVPVVVVYVLLGIFLPESQEF